MSIDTEKLRQIAALLEGMSDADSEHGHHAQAEIHASASRVILALAEDAARYHWLRDHSCPPHNFYVSVPDEFSGVRYGPSEVDAYIDDARRTLAQGRMA